MTYDGTICTEAEITVYAGENVDATGNTEANHNDLVAQAESYLSNLLRFDVVAGYAGLNANVKRILSEWAARYAGNALIAFNMGGYTTRTEATEMMNWNYFRMEKIERVLRDQNTITWMVKQ